MANFERIARGVNEIAEAAFAENRRAAENQRKAEERRRACPQRQTGIQTAEYAAQSARAAADYAEAVAEVERVRQKMTADGEYARQIAQLRAELAAAVEDEYSVDAAEIDEKSLALLQSGIMGAADYASMMHRAEKSGNYTLMRLAGKYAGDAAAAREADPLHGNDGEAQRLRAIAIEAQQHNGANIMEAFDAMAYAFSRCAENEYMMPSWESLTAPLVAQIAEA